MLTGTLKLLPRLKNDHDIACCAPAHKALSQTKPSLGEAKYAAKYSTPVAIASASSS